MAKANKGWIKVYRDIQQSKIWQINEPFDARSAWIDMLLMANHKDCEVVLRSGVKVIKRGQFHTSIGHLAKRWGWSAGKVRRYIRLLNDIAMVHTDGTPDGTTVTIVKYDNFQGEQQANDTPNDTSNGTPDGTTGGTRTRMNKECNKNDNKNKKKNAPLTNAFGYEVEE